MYVMGYVRFGDAVGERRGQPGHHGAQVSQKVPIVRRQRAPWKSEPARTVVW